MAFSGSDQRLIKILARKSKKERWGNEDAAIAGQSLTAVAAPAPFCASRISFLFTT